jgi:chorismate synthase
MAGNSFGQVFVVTTCGESHGPGLMAIVDGCPPGIELTSQDFEKDIDRRRTGTSRYTSQRKEADIVEIISGVFEGKTTGTPIGLLIRNTDARSADYSAIKDQFRPGHADFTYEKKYGIRDYRGGGRSSARETVMRVAAGVIAKRILTKLGIRIRACVISVGELQARIIDWNVVEENPFYFPSQEQLSELESLIAGLRSKGDSVGAILQVEAHGVPIGFGEPVFSKLDADIAGAMMGINAVKAVEIGQGFEAASTHGTLHRDAIGSNGFLSNRSGGILGGISNGEPIVARVGFKPTSSMTTPIKSIDKMGDEVTVVTKGRHDPCVGLRAVPIVEAMMALVLVDHYLRDRAQIGPRNAR